MTNQEYILWSELMGEQYNENELNQFISEFDKVSTFNFLTNVNNFLALFPPSFEKGDKFQYIQNTLITNFLDDNSLNKYNQSFSKIKSSLSRPTFIVSKCSLS